MLLDVVVGLLAIAGGGFAFVAGLGVARMPDVYIRMHASSKAGTLGCGLVLAAVALHSADVGIVARALAGVFFLLFTAPVGAHLIGRAAHRTGVPPCERTVVDESAGPKT